MHRIFSVQINRVMLPALLVVTTIVIVQLPLRLWLPALLLSWALLALAWVDIRMLLLPDLLTLPLLWVGLLASSIGALPGLTPEQAVYGAAAGYSTLWLLSGGYRLLRGKEGLGLGDAKLLAALGAWTGPERLPWIVLLATLITAAALLVAWLLFRYPLNVPIPFGPALAFAGWTLFLWFYG